MRLRQHWQVCSAIFCSLLFSLASTSSSAQAATVNAVTELFYPFQIMDDENSLTGYSVEVAKRLSARAGDQLNIELLPWSVAYHKGLDSHNLMIFSIGRNVQREELFQWIGSVAKEELFFWALNSTPIPYSDQLESFRNYRIAVIKDATTHQSLTNRGFPNLYLMSATDSNVSEVSRIKMLLKERADIMIATEQSIAAALDDLRYAPDLLKKVYRAVPLSSDLYIAFSKNTDAELLVRYKAAFESMRRDGTLQSLRTKWEISTF